MHPTFGNSGIGIPHDVQLGIQLEESLALALVVVSPLRAWCRKEVGDK